MEPRQRHIGNLSKRASTPKGLTLVEVLIVVGIVAMISSFGLLSSSQSRQQARIAAEGVQLQQELRTAQNRSLASYLGRSWAVRCNGASLTTFAFSSTEPEVSPTTYMLPNGFSCSGSAPAIKFMKLTGRPEVATSFTLQLAGQDVQRIDVSMPGTITLVRL